MPDLSILIPARNEEFLRNTIDDILKNMRGDTEIIVVLDGQWPVEPLPIHERVTIIYHSQSIGQRAATNEAAKISTAKYVMKCDAHCAFGEGFDVIMMEDIQDDWTLVPKMYNLHVFDWVCPDGHRRYQGPSGVCEQCGKETRKEIVWKPKSSPETTSMIFDKSLKFGYWSGYKKQQSGDLVETMSILGACWMCTREKYFELDMCDERHGSWGQQGTEVACKTWLSGGKLIVTKKTWFAHMFRTQGGDFGFPYPLSGRQIGEARNYSKNLWLNNSWDKAKRSLAWLVTKFNPPEWRDLPKEIVYYTDNNLDETIIKACQRQLEKSGLPIISVSLKPMDFGKNIHFDITAGYLAMFKQILAGLEASTADIIFLCEHDVLYHPSHFEFIPTNRNTYYYNENVWKVHYQTGQALFHYVRQTSGLCAYRETLIEHYRERVRRTEEKLNALGNTRAYRDFIRRQGFEPGTHGRSERVDDLKAEGWMSEYPNIDIRHNKNLTPSRWSKDQFRNQRYTKGWMESDEVPGWGKTKGRFSEFLI